MTVQTYYKLDNKPNSSILFSPYTSTQRCIKLINPFIPMDFLRHPKPRGIQRGMITFNKGIV